MPDEDSLSVNSLFVEPPREHKSFSLVSEIGIPVTSWVESFSNNNYFFLLLQRKRKKEQDDNTSTHSLYLGDDEGPSKRKKRLGRVASLANIFSSPGKPLQNAKQALKKSISGMLHPSVKEQAPPKEERQHSPTPSVVSIPSSPALLRTRGSIVSLSRLSVSSFTSFVETIQHITCCSFLVLTIGFLQSYSLSPTSSNTNQTQNHPLVEWNMG